MTPSTSVAALAIIVPAYRARFLADALVSLTAQTDQNFHLYVCDNGSRENLYSIYETHCAYLRNATFVRFEDNPGAAALVPQWNRCVAASRQEPWVWLFSDDDIVEPNCVAAFHAERHVVDQAVNVWRFNTLTINSAGAITRINPPHPASEFALEFAYHRLMHVRASYAPEYIFRRAAFDANNGFVNFPFALGSDDASWITFSGDQPIRTLAGDQARVLWRQSEFNTSGLTGPQTLAKLCAAASYAGWLRQWLADRDFVNSPSAPLALPSIKDLLANWFFGYMQTAVAGISTEDIAALAQHLAGCLEQPGVFWKNSLLKARRRRRLAAGVRSLRRIIR